MRQKIIDRVATVGLEWDKKIVAT